MLKVKRRKKERKKERKKHVKGEKGQGKCREEDMQRRNDIKTFFLPKLELLLDLLQT
jgi:hypothetical protein